MTRREVLQASALAVSGLASASKAYADTPTRFAVADDAEFFGALDLRRPALAAVKQAADAQNWARAKTAWAAHLTGRTTPRWTWSHFDRETITRVLDEKYGGLSGSILFQRAGQGVLGDGAAQICRRLRAAAE